MKQIQISFKNNKDFIQNWDSDGVYNVISEKSMLKMIFKEKEFLCRTKYAEITCCLRNEIPTKILEETLWVFILKP